VMLQSRGLSQSFVSTKMERSPLLWSDRHRCLRICDNQGTSDMSKRWLVLLLMTGACLAGCGRHARPLPQVYPVHGAVTYSNGKPVVEGIVLFTSEADTSLTASAMTGPDGRYSLTTIRDRVEAEGGPAGLNRVIVTPQGDEKNGRRGLVPPTVFPTPYKVEPRDNEINLTIAGTSK
jgi:hypothetical protein